MVAGCVMVVLFVYYLANYTGKPESRALSEVHYQDDSAGGSDDSPNGEPNCFSMDEFSHIEIGVSTKEDLMEIAPRVTAYQHGRGEVIQFPLDDGRIIEFVCRAGIVSEISFRG